MKYKLPLLIGLPILLTAQACTFSGIPGLGGGSTQGGILKSIDNGETWEQANRLDAENNFVVNTVDFDTDPNDENNLYLAAGERGLFASKNKAETWAQILSGALIASIVVNRQNSDELLAGGSVNSLAKLFHSQDQGKTWVEVYSESNTGSYVSAVDIDPGNADRIVIALSTGAVLESANKGVSWGFVANLEGRILDLDFISESPGVAYALSISKGLYRSTNSGRSWNLISNSITEANRSVKYTDYAQTTLNSSLVYLATNTGLFRSLNSGTTWQNLRLPTHEAEGRVQSDRPTISAVTVGYENARLVYATVGRIFYKSVDGGTTWQTNTLPFAAYVREITQDPEEKNIIYTALGQPL